MTAPTASVPLLDVRQLGFERQDEAVFGPLDFSLQDGETAVIEGDNGSGKTTLLRILAGLLHPSRGEVSWRGKPFQPAESTGERLLLGHQLGLKADLTAQENLEIAAGLHGTRAGWDANRALHDVGLAGYEHEWVRRLSAGQKKRVALARLLLVPATLWLLDEPYANLDRHGIALVNRLIDSHADQGGSILMSSHGTVNFHAGQPTRIRMQA